MNFKANILASAALFSALALSAAAMADDIANADPACVITNADGSKALDTTKCKDGKPMAANDTMAPADGTAANTGTTTGTDATTTSSTTPTGSNLIVPPESMTGARVMTASDFIGKRVYSKAGDDIGEVNDLFVTDKGNVQAVVLGVGGFLGIGEKDVAVSMGAIEMVQDGNAVRLVVDTTKDQLQAAPAYDRSKRTYITN